jgi:hypothetical protein
MFRLRDIKAPKNQEILAFFVAEMSMAALPLWRSRRGSDNLFLFSVATRRDSGNLFFFTVVARRGSGRYPTAMAISASWNMRDFWSFDISRSQHSVEPRISGYPTYK